MDTLKHGYEEKNYMSYMKFERSLNRYGWIIYVLLILADIYVRRQIANQSLDNKHIILQCAFALLYIIISYIKLSKGNLIYQKPRIVTIIKIFEIVAAVCLISTLYNSIMYYFVALLPITIVSLSRGFKGSIVYLMLGWATQNLSQHLYLRFIGGGPDYSHQFPCFYLVIISIHYLLFTVFCFIWGDIFNEYIKSEEENKTLIDRLGDKFIQLEQAQKEIQSHYDKLIKTNNILEETNNKLTTSVAEFFTLQQISQAITSIFDMNELLKFVNDVIIGVMGVYHSTIALCSGPNNKLKVQVSSIFDKKDLAIVSDYINCDIITQSSLEGHSMIDNNVNTSEYPFTKGRNIQSLICVPFFSKGRPLGVVLIEHSIKDAFDDENMRLLEVIAQQVSIAIENARLYQQMHDLATHDALTGAYNRLYFNDKIIEEFNNALDRGHDLSFIILDIDFFKKFNDTYGHLFGDLVLKTISKYIMKTLRKEDMFARYGGEEFVILMPYTSLEQAAEKAEEIREGVSKLIVSDRVISASVTISIGVSSYPETSGRPQELVSMADDALYKAKESGRNRVCISKPKSEN